MKLRLYSTIKNLSLLNFLIFILSAIHFPFCHIASCYSDVTENRKNTDDKLYSHFSKCQCGTQFTKEKIKDQLKDHMKKHVLVIQKDGRLCVPESHGKETLITKDEVLSDSKEDKEYEYIDAIIENMKNWHQRNPEQNKQIVIFIHGGLNEFENSYRRVRKLLYCNYDESEEDKNSESYRIPENIYPIFINWESGPLSSYWDYVANIRQGETYSGGQKVFWRIASPFIVLADMGKAIVRMPYVTAYQSQNYFKTLPIRHELATETINELYANETSTSKVEYNHSFDGKRTLEDIGAVPLLPFKLLVATLVDAGGKGAWETMYRRTQTMFNSPEEFLQNVYVSFPLKKDYTESKKHKDAKKAAPARIIDRSTGSLSKFMDKLAKEFQDNQNKEYRFNLIGHSMGTIIISEILRRYEDFFFQNIVFMGAACSINDFRDSVISYLDKHNDGKNSTKFYNLCLHPRAEQRESHAYGLIPRGSLLEWLDNFLTSPNTTLDRRLGKWENILRTTNIIPESDRERVYLKAFKYKQEKKEEYEKRCEECEKCHPHSPKIDPPKNPGNPMRHSEFTDQKFWEEVFWKP